MFLKMLSADAQKVFLQACVLAAKSNGIVAEKEQAMMSEYCHEMGYTEQISWVDVPTERVLYGLSGIESERDKRIILLEILGLVKADNEYDADEREFVNNVITALGLSQETSEKIAKLLDKYLDTCKELAATVLN